jgi:hypothetical protein
VSHSTLSGPAFNRGGSLFVHNGTACRGLLLLSALSAAACSSQDLHPVEGKVIYKTEPAGGVVVTFHPKDGDPFKTIRPIGLTKEDGVFTLATGQKDGAQPGEYVVTFIRPVEVEAKEKKAKSLDMGAPSDTRDAFGGAYVEAEKSTFKVEIRRGPNKLEPFILK